MARKFTVEDGLAPVDLLHCGLDHLAASKALFKLSPAGFDSAGYLAHIGVELLLKAWLLHGTKEFEGIHNCRALYEQAREKCGGSKLTDEQASVLCDLDQYESLRYPDRNNPTEIGDDSWGEVEALIGHICRSLPKELSGELEKIKAGTKSGRVLMRKRIDEPADHDRNASYPRSPP